MTERGCWSRSGWWRRFFAGGAEGAVDHHPHLLFRKSTVDVLAIYEEVRSAFHTEGFGFFH